MEEKKYTSLIRLRMSAKDAHYGGNLVDGAHMVHLFGDGPQPVRAVVDGVERGRHGQQHLRGADVRRGPVAANVLLAGLQRQP